ncbi:MAG: formate-dependent phosphoribosylglycinamide formyltransferase [Sphingobacteriia bacterium]|jgi:phosphoribosylglycinamide formyltransferase 2|nr:formate-dependent phosphoribosylglycinamide formyltransferase [Sphingobacteriia bacterium]
MTQRILLLGSGELGKELVIALQRLGQYVIAVDHYANAPAMQVAHAFEVCNMLDGQALDAVVKKYNPDIIVPEIEAIRTERFFDYEAQGILVVPSARAANITMNRKAIRNLAAETLQLKTAAYLYADTIEAFKQAVNQIGLPCVVKPLMSSSGKGQSVLRDISLIEDVWNYAMEGSRGDYKEVIVEAFIPFDFEITLLTLTQKQGPTLCCAPIGHRQERGDYQESWQPCAISNDLLKTAEAMAKKVTQALGGAGIWGVEFFICKNEVYFSELSPRPHDTGMVTLAHTQFLNEFELHARAILGYPVPEIPLLQNGASAVILAQKDGGAVSFKGIEKVFSETGCDVRVFNKPFTRPYRRMGVVLCSGNAPVTELTEQAKRLASDIRLEYQ